jgi:hypothetical protein
MPFGEAVGQGFVNPGVVIANLVEIIGAKGRILIYSPTAAFGNLIGSWAGTAGVDAFGNAYPQGLAIFNHFLTIQDPAQIIFPSGDSMEGTAANLFAAVIGSGAARFLQSLWSGPKGNPIGATDWVQMQLNSGNDGATTDANIEFIYIDIAGNPHDYMTVDSNAVFALGVMFAIDPNVSPSVLETFKPLGTGLGATWTVNQTRYRRMADSAETEIDIAINAQAGGGAAGVFTFANSLPSYYCFAGNYSRAFPLGYNGVTGAVGTNSPSLLVDGNGSLFPGRVRILLPALPATTNVGGVIRFPLS